MVRKECLCRCLGTSCEESGRCGPSRVQPHPEISPGRLPPSWAGRWPVEPRSFLCRRRSQLEVDRERAG
ncbi:hypothetical protein ACFPRL_04870 [Pseudoclavibacter helvolus]